MVSLVNCRRLSRSPMALWLLVRRPSEDVVMHSTASEGRCRSLAKATLPTAYSRVCHAASRATAAV